MMIFSIIIIVIYTIIVIRLLFNHKYFIFYPIIINSIFVPLSLIYIENGGFISEAGIYGYFIGASVMYIYFMTLYLLGVKTVFFLGQNLRGINESDSLEIPYAEHKFNSFQFALLVIIVTLFLLWINMIISPMPLFSMDVSRFNYWENSKLSFLTKIFGNVTTIIAFTLGYLYWYYSYMGKDHKEILKYKKIVIILLVLFIIYLAIMGHKFSAIESSLFYFALAFTPWINKKITINKYIIKYLVLIGIIMVGLIYYEYYRYQYYIDISDSVFGQIAYRILGLQGGVWWTMIDEIINHDFRPTFNIKDLLRGMDLLMILQSGYTENVMEFIEMGGKYTNAYPAILLYIFPIWLASIVQYIIGMATSLFVLYVYHNIKKLNVIRAILSIQLIMWLFYAEIQAYFIKIISPLALVFIFILIMAELSQKSINTN